MPRLRSICFAFFSVLFLALAFIGLLIGIFGSLLVYMEGYRTFDKYHVCGALFAGGIILLILGIRCKKASKITALDATVNL